jgi:hypothetical protein
MFIRSILILTVSIALVGCGSGGAKALSEAEQKAAADKMKAEMDKMNMQLPAKLPQQNNMMMQSPAAPPKK